MASQITLPKVTIVSVCFNAIRVAEATIKSVLALDYPNLEYIVVDNQSTDGTLELLNRYKWGIHQLIVEPDNGPYDAMNKGINASSGAWIWFMNMGDSFPDDPQLLRKIFQSACPEEVGVLYGNTLVQKAGFSYHVSYGDPVERNIKTGILNLNHQSMLCRKSAFRRFGTFDDTNFRIKADACWLTGVFSQAGKGYFRHTHQLMAVYNEEGLSSSHSNFSQMYREDKLILERYGNKKQQQHLCFNFQVLKIRLMALNLLSRIKPLHNWYRKRKFGRRIHSIQ